jgi:hypothetical protein
MADITMLIPKRQRPEWIADLEAVDMVPAQMVAKPRKRFPSLPI